MREAHRAAGIPRDYYRADAEAPPLGKIARSDLRHRLVSAGVIGENDGVERIIARLTARIAEAWGRG